MHRRVKRSSSSPAPPPPPAARPRPPPPDDDDQDYDELDFLPSTSPPKPRLASAKPPPPRLPRARPTCRSSPRTTAASSTAAPGLNTPSASPQAVPRPATRSLDDAPRRASDGASRTRSGTTLDDRDLRVPLAETRRRASHGTTRSVRAGERDEHDEGDDAAEQDGCDDAPSPAKRRRSGTLSRKGLVFKAPDVALDAPRRSRQRVERDEGGARASTSSASPVKAPSRPRSRVLVLDDDDDDEEDDVDEFECDELAAAPARRIKPDPDGAPLALDPRPPPARARAAAPSAAPKPTRAPPSPSSAPPSRPAPLGGPSTSSFAPFIAGAGAAPPARPARVPAPAPTSTPASSSSAGPPTVPAFLLSLPLPSLARLSPLLHGLGLSTALDLVQLAAPSPAARRARDKVLERVDAMDRVTKARAAPRGAGEEAGGVTAWERIVLEEELDEVWRKWGGGAAEGALA